MKPLLKAAVAIALAITLVTATAWAVTAQQDTHHGGQTAATAITTTVQAQQQATAYLTKVGLTNLAVDKVLPFAQSFYIAIVDPASGAGAFELLVDRSDGSVHPEPGPTMMWNTEYSPMFGTNGAALGAAMGSGMMDGMMGRSSGNHMGGGMMGGSDNDHMNGAMDGGMMSGSSDHGMMGQDSSGAASTAGCPAASGYQAGAAEPLAQPLTTDAAVARAQTWLTEQRSIAIATDPVAFPGYVTVSLERDGQIVGLLSVQTSTGALWQHVWHDASS